MFWANVFQTLRVETELMINPQSFTGLHG